MYEEDIIKYLLKVCEGLHPFYISRIAALLDMEYIKERGNKLTDFDYQKMQYGFYSTKLPAMIEKIGVEKVQSENGNYVKLKGDVEIHLPDEIKARIERILDEVCNMSEDELNKKVLTSPYYSQL